jgi:hypothetical protein
MRFPSVAQVGLAKRRQPPPLCPSLGKRASIVRWKSGRTAPLLSATALCRQPPGTFEGSKRLVKSLLYSEFGEAGFCNTE